MRPAPGKMMALLIDLRGMSYIHGLPAADRKFQLKGVAIETAEVEEEKHCPMCGRIIEGKKCPNADCNKAGESQVLETPHRWTQSWCTSIGTRRWLGIPSAPACAPGGVVP